ncbi:MAG TPA: protein phosphatase CheZ [Steroidobacteraceae bacterium]|nr:protein phosphatase CheZ [Steroidobacteraceae bacterium]
MATMPPEPERYRDQVAALQCALDSGDAAGFRLAFDALSAQMDVGLLPELKRITATAQSALARFSAEARLDTLAGHEVPDARKRLTHVVNLTDEAAHRTMDLVDGCGPLVDEAARGSAMLLESWDAYGDRDLAIASLWPERAAMFLERTRADSDVLRSNLSELLLAQGYQDITGQIIRSVIALVDELENVLGKLVQIADGNEVTSLVRSLPAKPDWERGLGPQVAGIESTDAMSGQDDIDALLSQMAAGK